MKNNKGFSLVELIIVIAIMAVLVGVLAPTYLQYVEKSKKSNDVSTVDSVINALEIAAIDPEVNSEAWTHIDVKINTSGMTVSPDTPGAAIEKAFKEIVGTDIKFKSAKWGGDVCIRATNGTNGKITLAYYDTTNNKGNTAFQAYATSLTKIS